MILRNKTVIAALFLLCALLMSACGETVNVIPAPPVLPSGADGTAAVEGLRLNLQKAALEVGQSTLLAPTVLPLNAGNRTVRFESSDENVVKVNGRGRITGLSRGSATVTVTTEEGGFSASCAVEVTEREHHVEGEEGVRVESVQLSASGLSLRVGDETVLTASVLPENAQNKKLTWINSNTRSILLEDGGKITAVGTGRAVVTAIAEDGGVSAACEITVTARLQRLSLPSDAVRMTPGAMMYLTAIPEPAEVPNLTLTYHSTNPWVASVDGTDGVTARSEGIATVSASGNGHTAKCLVTVMPGGTWSLSALSVRQNSLSLLSGESMTLFVTKTPESTDREADLQLGGSVGGAYFRHGDRHRPAAGRNDGDGQLSRREREKELSGDSDGGERRT